MPIKIYPIYPIKIPIKVFPIKSLFRCNRFGPPRRCYAGRRATAALVSTTTSVAAETAPKYEEEDNGGYRTEYIAADAIFKNKN